MPCLDCVFPFVSVIILSIICFGAVFSGTPGTRRIRIALCQIVCIAGDRAGNFKRIGYACEEAAGNGADVACFPETSILGWVNPDAHIRSFPIPGGDTDRLCELAKRYGLCISIGLAEKEGDRLYNSAVLIDYKGFLLMKHRKNAILAELMKPPYEPGDSMGTVKTPFGVFGLLICADTFDRGILDTMAAWHPDILCVPHGWAATPYMWPCHGERLVNVVSRAARKSGAVVVGVNSIGRIAQGPWEGRIFGGGSVIADRDGRIIATAKDRDRDVLVVDVQY